MRLLLCALLILLAVPLVGEAEAQPSARMYRIGVLANALDTSDGPTFQAFLDGLRGLGYVKGRNMDIEWRSSEGNAEQLPALAMDLVRAKVDIILATALVPAQAAIEATKTVPIAFVASLAKPGANATGLASYAPQESSDRVVQLLKTVTPKLSRLGVLTVPSNPAQRELVARALPQAAQRAGVMLLPLPLQEASDLPGAFDTARGDRADGLYVLGDVLTFVHRARILELVAKNRLPAIYTNRSAVEAGGLMSYGPNLRELFRRAASYVDQILRGAKAGEMPVDQSARFELALNLKTANGLGLSVPQSLVKQAVQVIQ